MTKEEFKNRANHYGLKHEPFLFLTDFELKKLLLWRLDETKSQNILFNVEDKSNYISHTSKEATPNIEIFPVDYEKYSEAFNRIIKNIIEGNTYLLNLTFPTKIKTDNTLSELFHISQAPYKLYFNNKFILFSPECFVKTINNQIFSYPMKGTINADLPDAEEQILKNSKEEWEHNTITDLIRNNLATVARNITVTKFRYVTKIRTNKKNLLQVSSEITGELSDNWQKNIGDILLKLLPAGSISGAPQQKTIEIIRETEKLERGYFTGVFGIFDGTDINSAVNIRFIEKTNEGLQFRSGGGITYYSNSIDEYNEMINKVYIPV